MNSCEKIIEDVLTENYGQFYRLAYGYVRNEEDALDIVQESAYKAIKEAGKTEKSCICQDLDLPDRDQHGHQPASEKAGNGFS